MLLKKARLSLLAIIALVALRFVIGYHFYMEGSTKVKEGNFSSKPFLSAAKGPLADKFHQMVPDFEGRFRLPELRDGLVAEKQKPTKTDPDKVLSYGKLMDYLSQYVEQAAKLYEFTDEQKSAANEYLLESQSKLNDVVEEWGPQIAEYLRGFDRVARNRQDQARLSVDGLRKQKDEIESKWKTLAAPALGQVDKVINDLETNVNALATDAQRGEKNKKYADFKFPGEGSVSVDLIDKCIPIFDMVVGILLMIGLLTPLAGIASGLFLASVVLSQFPGSHGATPTYYQAIEMIGCFVLAFADAGRYAGVDFLPWAFWNRNATVIEES